MFFLMFRPRLFFAALTAVCGDPVAVEPAQHTALIIETVLLRSVLPPQSLTAAHFPLHHFFSTKRTVQNDTPPLPFQLAAYSV